MFPTMSITCLTKETCRAFADLDYNGNSRSGKEGINDIMHVESNNLVPG